MASIPKQVAQQLAQIAKQTGEAIIKEPKQLAKTATEQVGLSALGEKGVEKSTDQAVSQQQLAQIQKKREEDKKKIEFYRRKLREYQGEAKKPAGPPAPSEEQVRAAQEAEETEKKKLPDQISAPGGPSKRGTALLGQRKKSQGSGEMGAFARRSR